MRKDVELFFAEYLKRNIGGDFVNQIETVDADHGWTETRRHTVCSEIDWLSDHHNWPGLEIIVMTEYTREIKGKAKQRDDFTFHHSLIAQRKWRGTSATTGKWKIVCIVPLSKKSEPFQYLKIPSIAIWKSHLFNRFPG